MLKADVIIIGGGQAGLAMSRCLTARDIDHVVLERGRIGERWHSERWQSLHLLTTNAMSALPGLPYRGSDPDGFMPAQAFATYLQEYAERTGAPIINGVTVARVDAACYGYRVATNAGDWRARAVVIATGACDTPYRPPSAEWLSPDIVQLSPNEYQAPSQLPDGGVLVVGAAATGVQLAEEIHASGRCVTLAVGEHTRLPRRYRGRDIYAWMELAGILDDPPPDSGNIDAARPQPSPQLVGRANRRDLDLAVLKRQGVRLVGRLAASNGNKVEFNGDLARSTVAAQTRLLRVLDRIDHCIEQGGHDATPADPAQRVPVRVSARATTVDLQRDGIRAVIWATGYVRRYPWLKIPVLDTRGEIVHHGGVTAAPGLYALGLNFMRRRRSSFISGCALDAQELVPLIKAHLDLDARQVA